MTGVAFARLLSFLLKRAGFTHSPAGEIPEVQAIKFFLLQLIADCTDRITATLDELANQVSVSNDKSAKAVSESTEQQAQFETEIQKKEAELVNLRLRVDGLARENAAMSESLQKANKVAELLERQNSEKAAEIGKLKNQIEVAIGSRFGGIEEGLAEIKNKLGNPDAKAA
jgi:chromosome segregation ATPase